MADEKFSKVSVKEGIKRDIDIIAAAERRHVYEVVEDAVRLYMAISYGKGKKPKAMDPVTLAEVVTH